MRELTRDWLARGEETARDLARHASDRIRSVWEPEDPDRILEESRLFEGLPVGEDPADPELLSLRWRNEALLALSSAGVLSLEDEIIQHTDRLFHAGAPTPELSERLFGEDYSELHRCIDTVPGSGVPGGGITHRMEHGHDLQAAAISQSERPGVSVGDRDLEWRPRPLSAAANYYLAARAVLAVPFAEAAVGPERLRGNALELLRRAEVDSRPAEQEAVADRWDATLADDMGLAS